MSELVCSFTIPGYCQPKQRTFGRSFITPPATRLYERTVKSHARLAMNGKPSVRSFVGLEIEIICRIPPSWSKLKKSMALKGEIFPTNCDIDNQIKALADGMNGVIYEDDRQINSLIVRREFGPEDKVIITAVGLPR